jgi:hypothetical protein
MRSHLYNCSYNYSMEPSNSWGAKNFSTSQEFPHILWDPKVHYHSQNCLTPVPILRQLDPLNTHPHPTSWESILILSSHLYLGLLSVLFRSGFPTKNLYTTLQFPTNPTCPVHPILDFITCAIFGEGYKINNSYIMQFSSLPCYLVPLRPKYWFLQLYLVNISTDYISLTWKIWYIICKIEICFLAFAIFFFFSNIIMVA